MFFPDNSMHICVVAVDWCIDFGLYVTIWLIEINEVCGVTGGDVFNYN